MDWKKDLKKFYHFLVHDNSIWSWIVNIILAFVIVKFIIFPGLGWALDTDYPLVAVVSGSMEHEGLDLDEWWDENGAWYEENGVEKAEFEAFRMKNGFNKGDVIILKNKDVEVGDIVVYQGGYVYPIIHRVTFINEDENTVVVKGDNNDAPDPFDVNINEIEGMALYKIPWIGWVKLVFANLIGG
ncbi:signal peptidase I [archaeon]|jgi:signal peptidase I|nr:signal peptidase I [archaeon]MBT4416950.1 signal peptidase I [archaeon]